MLLPIRTKNPPETFPVATVILIAVNVLIFAFTSNGFVIKERMLELWGLKSSQFDFTHMLSSMFLHADIFHILGNMLFLYLFGFAVEGRLKTPKFLLVYFASGFAGDLLHHYLVGMREPNLPSLGASGAIMGVVAAAMWIFPFSKVSVFYWFGWFWRGVFDCPMWGVGLWYLGYDVLMAFVGAQDGVGHLAHVGGALGGLLVCLVFRPKRDSAMASEAKATLADTKELRTLSRLELEELHRTRPEDTAIIVNLMHKAARDPGGLRPEHHAIFTKSLPRILREQGAGQVATCIGMMPEGSISAAHLMQTASELERTGDHASASRLYEMVSNHPQAADADLEAAAFRTALIAERVFGDVKRAWAWYEYVVTKWPMGTFAPQCRARMQEMRKVGTKPPR